VSIFFLETLVRQVANKSKFDNLRHHHSKNSLLCVWLRRCWINSTLISLVWHFWFHLVVSSVMHCLILRWWTLKIYQTIFFNILIHQAVFQRDVLFCNSFSSYVFELCETKEIILFRNSELSKPQLLDKVKLYLYQWLKTTNFNLVSNYHIVGGRAHLHVWTSINYSCCYFDWRFVIFCSIFSTPCAEEIIRLIYISFLPVQNKNDNLSDLVLVRTKTMYNKNFIGNKNI
jgi:hypothetical protein